MKPGETVAPLTAAQQSFWSLEELVPRNSFSNLISGLAIDGPVRADTLARTFDEIMRRHEALRTSFERQDGRPVQRIRPPAACDFRIVDFSEHPDERQGLLFIRLVLEEHLKPFDFATGPMFRAVLVRFSDSQWAVVQAFHHIVCDDWSRQIVNRELFQLYEAFLTGAAPRLYEPRLQYRDYAAEQARRGRDGSLDAQRCYWRRKLAGAKSPIALPTDRPRPAEPSFRTDRRSLTLSHELSAGLKRLAGRSGCTLMMVMLAVFKLFLVAMTGTGDVRVGTLLATRNRARWEDVVGLFLNTVVLRTDLSGPVTFEEVLRRTRDAVLEAYENQDLPFEQLVQTLEQQNGLRREALFQVMFLYHPALPPPREIGGLTVHPLDFKDLERSEVTPTSFDLIMIVREKREGLVASLVYKRDLFDAATVDAMLVRFRDRAIQAVSAPDAVVGLCTPPRATAAGA
jgi:hypothetical protein